jgi:hypothetical protein
VQVFQRVIERTKYLSTGEFAWAGVALWLCGKPQEAARKWQDGLGTQYTDEAGGMELPLLLYYAAVRRPESISRAQADALLTKQLAHPWAECWPGALGAYLLGELTEEQVREKSVSENEPVTREQTAQVDFYFGVASLAKGDRDGFIAMMRTVAATPGCEGLSEFHLARFETDSAKVLKGKTRESAN